MKNKMYFMSVWRYADAFLFIPLVRREYRMACSQLSPPFSCSGGVPVRYRNDGQIGRNLAFFEKDTSFFSPKLYLISWCYLYLS